MATAKASKGVRLVGTDSVEGATVQVKQKEPASFAPALATTPVRRP